MDAVIIFRRINYKFSNKIEIEVMTDKYDKGIGPFIKPKHPVILSKKLKSSSDLKSHFYFCADSEFRLITEKGDFIHKYTIRFCELFPVDSYRLPFGGYDGYSLTITKFENRYSAELTNWDVKHALDILIKPIGFGIGSIILNHLFQWAKDMYPKSPAPTFSTSIVDEYPGNKERRDRLYSKIGLLENRDNLISDLTPTIDTKEFEIIPSYQFMRELLIEKQKLMNENKMLIEKIYCLEKDNEYLREKRYKYSIFQIHHQIENLILCVFDLTIGNLISLFRIFRDKITLLKK